MLFSQLLIAPVTFLKTLFKFLNHHCDLDGTGFSSLVILDTVQAEGGERRATLCI